MSKRTHAVMNGNGAAHADSNGTQESPATRTKLDEVSISDYLLTRLEQVCLLHTSAWLTRRSSDQLCLRYIFPGRRDPHLRCSRRVLGGLGDQQYSDGAPLTFLGDFFLRFLDYVEDHPKIEWVGCTNEVSQRTGYHFPC